MVGIRLKSKFRFRFIYLIAVVVFCLTLYDIAYLKILIGKLDYLQLFNILAAVGLIVIHGMKTHIRVPRIVMLLVATVIYILAITLLKGGSLWYSVQTFSAPICLCLVFGLVRSTEELHQVLKIWCVLLFGLLMLDFLTMIVFPSGLYKSEFYTDNWFLGYKTFRFHFTFPLLVLYFYLQLSEKRRLTKSAYILAVLVIANIARSFSMGGSIMVTMFVLIVILLSRGWNDVKMNRLEKVILSLIRNYLLVLAVYFLVFYVIIVLPSNPYISAFLENYLHKTADFSGRTPIWLKSLDEVGRNPVIGYGLLTSSEYMKFTGGYVNPHNTILTYLLEGGLIGSGMMLVYMGFVAKSAKKDRQNYIFVCYMYVIFFLGLVSSALAFSPMYYTLLILPLYRLELKKDTTEVLTNTVRKHQ